MLADLILETAATCFAFFFITSPLRQALEVIAAPEIVQHVNPVNLLCFFLNSVTQLAYGVFMPIAPLIPANAYGVAVGLFSIITCWCMAQRAEKADRWNRQACAGTVAVAALSASIIAYAWLGDERAPARVGNLGMLVVILMYAAPLSVLQEVVRTKSSKLLPPLQIFLGLLNTLCWFGVGVRHQKLPIWAPNMLGMLLSLVQLALILKYPSEGDAEAAMESSGLLQKERSVEDFVRSRTEELAGKAEEFGKLAKAASGIFEVNNTVSMVNTTASLGWSANDTLVSTLDSQEAAFRKADSLPACDWDLEMTMEREHTDPCPPRLFARLDREGKQAEDDGGAEAFHEREHVQI